MYLENRKNLLIGGAVVLACAVAAIGWSRRDTMSAPAPVAMTVDNTNPAAYATAAPMPDSGDGYYSRIDRPVLIRTQTYNPPPVEQFVDQGADQRFDQRAGQDARYSSGYYETQSSGGQTRRVYRRGRSKTHSLEIIGGTAAAGAIIGGIAGGGKGAAIGAVSGAGAGFVYDRLTHNR